jgi:NAD(P)-dependent dehydrogenase (short-subunit alcohol dehydrogenase family)
MSTGPSPELSSRSPAGLAGRVAVVTGAARGIGLATVQALVDAGAHPVLLDRDETALQHASAALSERGIDHRTFAIDVTDEAAVDAAFAGIVASCCHRTASAGTSTR